MVRQLQLLRPALLPQRLQLLALRLGVQAPQLLRHLRVRGLQRVQLRLALGKVLPRLGLRHLQRQRLQARCDVALAAVNNQLGQVLVECATAQPAAHKVARHLRVLGQLPVLALLQHPRQLVGGHVDSEQRAVGDDEGHQPAHELVDVVAVGLGQDLVQLRGGQAQVRALDRQRVEVVGGQAQLRDVHAQLLLHNALQQRVGSVQQRDVLARHGQVPVVRPQQPLHHLSQRAGAGRQQLDVAAVHRHHGKSAQLRRLLGKPLEARVAVRQPLLHRLGHVGLRVLQRLLGAGRAHDGGGAQGHLARADHMGLGGRAGQLVGRLLLKAVAHGDVVPEGKACGQALRGGFKPISTIISLRPPTATHPPPNNSLGVLALLLLPIPLQLSPVLAGLAACGGGHHGAAAAAIPGLAPLQAAS